MVARTANKGGKLTGRESLWHMTHKDNVESIKDQGFKGYDPKAKRTKTGLTGNVIDDIPIDKKVGKTYFSKRRMTSGSDPNIFTRASKRILKVSVPYGDLTETVNPELRGAKSSKEFKKILDKLDKPKWRRQPEHIKNIMA